MKKRTPIMAVIADTHVSTENKDLVINIFKQFIDLIKSLNLSQGVHVGDFFTSRASQSLVCLLAANEIIDMFEKENLTLIIIPGNHDKTDLDSEESYLTIFKNRKGVKLFEKEGFFDDDRSGVRFCFLPYFKENGQYLKRLSDLNDMVGSFSLRILFTHISINGVRNNDGTIVEGDVEQEFFEFYDLVFSGHYHDRSQISENIYYIGSSHQANYGEDDKKGFTVLYDDLYFDHIQSKFPHYKKFVIPAGQPDFAKNLFHQYKNSEDNITFVFAGNQNEIDSVDENIFHAAGIEVKFENVEEQGILFNNVDEATIINYDKKSVIKNFMEYTVLQNFSPTQKKDGIMMLTNLKF